MKKKRGDWKRTQKPFTLCWDCAHATDDSCAWVRDGEPVDGWTARETKLLWARAYSSSYHVNACPKFKRDAENGGQRKYVSHLEYVPLKGESNGSSNHNEHRSHDAWDRVVESPRPRPVGNGYSALADSPDGRTQCSLDHIERDILDLSYGIVERAVEDWKALDYGQRESVMIDGVLVERLETCSFFFGDFFIHICDGISYTPKQIRTALHISEDMLDILLKEELRKEESDVGF